MYSDVSLLLVDDHAIVVDGCAALLRQAGYPNVSIVTDSDAVLEYVELHKVDLILLDISMPGVGGLSLIKRIRKVLPLVKIIMFSMHDEAGLVSRAVDMGANGYLCKTCSPQEIIKAVNWVLEGNTYLSHSAAQNLALQRLNPVDNVLNQLSPKEYEIFELLVNGNTLAQIGDTFSLSKKTISNYITKIKSKLKATTTADLVHIGMQHKVTKLRACEDN